METEGALASPKIREGSPHKRAAILEAARSLFVSEGFDRTSMDAVAIRAKVSKRTVYDYFGDKRTLVLAVIEEVGQNLLDSITSAIGAHLADQVGIKDSERLAEELIAFAKEIASSTLESSDYANYMKLIAAEEPEAGGLGMSAMENAPEDAIGERLAHFAQLGLLEVPNRRRAADHFVALSFGLVVTGSAGSGGAKDQAERNEEVTEGVRAFLRAYAPRRDSPIPS